jgi:hypothetical protein
MDARESRAMDPPPVCSALAPTSVERFRDAAVGTPRRAASPTAASVALVEPRGALSEEAAKPDADECDPC